MNKTKYFLVITTGHSGSLWISKLLNSHPDCFCSHEGIHQYIFPRRYYEKTEKDYDYWFRSIISNSSNHYAQAYYAVGDVGSFNPDIMSKYPRTVDDFNIIGLIRHPVLYIRSQKHGFDEFKGEFPKLIKDKLVTSSKDALTRFKNIKRFINLDDPGCLIFLYSCMRWLTYYECMIDNNISYYRLIDLTTGKKIKPLFIETVGSMPPKGAITKIMARRVNSHIKSQIYSPKKIFGSEFSSRERRIYEIIIAEKERANYEEYPSS